MNILHVTLGFYPAVSWGGPVKIVHINAKKLVERGHNVTVYCTNLLNKRQKIQPHTFETVIDGIRIVYFDTWNFPWWPGTLGPIWLHDINSYLKQEINKFDIIHINGNRNLMLLPILKAAKQAKVPIVLQPHGAMLIITNSLLIKRVYDKVFGKLEVDQVKKVLALQDSERQQAIARGFSKEMIEIIPNGLDPLDKALIPQRGSFLKRLGLPKESRIILFLGRINKKKGTDMLIEAFSKLNDLDLKLVIAGPDDGQLSEVKDLIQKYKLEECVLLPGLLSGEDIYSAYQDAYLFVLPCRIDTFPTTIMESCLMETPMVVTEGCEIAYMIKNQIGDVVPFEAEAFANAIRELAINDERYQYYKGNCRNFFDRNFAVVSTIDKLEHLYKEVVEESR